MRVADRESSAVDVDTRGEGVQTEVHAGGFEIRVGAVGERLPGLHLAGEVVRDAADREVRIRIGHDNGDVDGRVEFAGPEGGGDSSVASADRYKMHEGAFQGWFSSC